MLVSVIIINYNTFKLTCDCIRSVKETTSVPHEIILIDNNSKECDPNEFLKIFPDLRLYPLKENVGFGRANNFGMDKAEGKYILLLNSDTVVYANAIDDTVRYLEEHPDMDILGCRVETLHGTQRTVYEYEGQLSFFKTAVVFAKRNAVIREILKPIHRLLHRKQPVSQIDSNGKATTASNPQTQSSIVVNYNNGKRIGVLVGVFLLFKKEVYLESKGFDPDFFMYHEELEWFLKRLQRFNKVYYPNASIMHYHGGSDVYNKMAFQLHVSHYLFWYKMSYLHFGLFFLYNLVEIPSLLLVGALKRDRTLLRHVPTIVKAFPYALFDIPRYSNAYGARKEMCKIKSLRKSNL